MRSSGVWRLGSGRSKFSDRCSFGRLARRALQPGPLPGSWLGGRHFVPASLCCSQLRAGAELTSLAALVSFKHAAPSQSLKRAARAPSIAALLGPSQIARQRPGLQCACMASDVSCLVAKAEPAGGPARRRAICARPTAQRSGSGARSAHQLLTWRHLFERSERSERSEFAAADPRSEQGGESARQSRPGHHEHGGGPGRRSPLSSTQTSVKRRAPAPGKTASERPMLVS